MEQTLGHSADIRQISPLNGGCTHPAYHLDTKEGSFFLKTSENQQVSFVAEAHQLEAMHQSGTTLIIPRPIASIDADNNGPGFLLLPYFAPGKPCKQWEEELGRGLALLHQSTSSSFGFDYDTFCGATRLDNRRATKWVPFFAEQRLQSLFDILCHRKQLDDTDQKRFSLLIKTLSERLNEPLVPSLLHGDLWAGNVITNQQGHPVLIDPAAYYGHPEAEFGMTTLYGGFSQRFYAAYQESKPLETNWQQRCIIYRFWHITNHAVLFGGQYIKQTCEILARICR